jgi:hypothetical protein
VTDQPSAADDLSPVLYLQQEALFTWERLAPGGCRCVSISSS